MMDISTKVLLVEDEFAVAIDLKTRLVKMGFEVLGIASSFDEAIVQVVAGNPHVVIMDIQIEGEKTGIDAARIIWDRFQIPVVYLTGLNEEKVIEEAMSTNPMGYILKPAKDVDIRNQIFIAIQQKNALDLLQDKVKKYENVIENILPDKTKNEILFVKDSKQIFKLSVQDIAYLEAMDNYTLLYTSVNDKYVMNGFLKDIIDRIASGSIIRIHRSYAVAKQHISHIEENTVTVGSRVLPVSKSHRESFYNEINPI